MRKAYSIGLWGILVLANSALLSQETNTVHQNRTVPKVSLATDAAGNPADRWRYRYYNGRWWYYHPSKTWSYWNGKAWTSYNRQTYDQRFERQLRPDVMDDGGDTYGIRPQGTIQREKNDARYASPGRTNIRVPDTIQREKNDVRDQSFERMYIRPPGTIQREKNNTRG